MLIPKGSWICTAKNYKVQNGVVSAELERVDGTWQKDWSEFDENTILVNNNGYFKKIFLPTGAPGGSWIETAHSAYCLDGFVHADLVRKDGTFNTTCAPILPDVSYSNQDGQFILDGTEHPIALLATLLELASKQMPDYAEKS